MKLRKILILTLALIMLMSTSTFARTLYAPDGRTINVNDREVYSYLNVGWYEQPVTTMYAPDGRSINVYTYDVAKWESVGWVDGRKTTTIYAPGGRTATIPLWQLQTYLNLGWSEHPVSTNTIPLYYPGTNVPKFDSIVSATPISEGYDYDLGCYSHEYNSTHDSAMSYRNYLMDTGFTYFDAILENEYSIFIYYNTTNVVCVTYIYSLNMVQVLYEQI